MDRRVVLGGALAIGAAGLAAPRATALTPSHGVVIPGAETWSESLMLLHFDPELRNGISVRISRYPQLDVTWVWCHVLFDGKMYAYTERRLPSGSARNLGEAPRGVYDCPAAGVAFTRTGPVDRLDRIHLAARVMSRQSSAGQDGPGDIPVAIAAAFRPRKLKENPPAGRSEWTGDVEIDLSVGGRTVRLSGVAKAHEQTQSAPRFHDPFTYAMMWSPTGSFISTASPKRRYGDYEADGVSRGVEEFRPTPPAAVRPFSALLKDGQVVRGVATRVAAYDVPVYDRMWNGNVVRIELAGRPLVGMLNDWRPEAQVYAPV